MDRTCRSKLTCHLKASKSNRHGKPGGNINRDRRMEYSIGAAKKLISNLGPNLNEAHVHQVNSTLDIKEELFLHVRESHGVNIRSGRHNPRSDSRDYEMLFSHLTETRAHKRIRGRTFGDYNLPENILDDERLKNAGFFRWLLNKNKEAKNIIQARQRKRN